MNIRRSIWNLLKSTISKFIPNFLIVKGCISRIGWIKKLAGCFFSVRVLSRKPIDELVDMLHKPFSTEIKKIIIKELGYKAITGKNMVKVTNILVKVWENQGGTFEQNKELAETAGEVLKGKIYEAQLLSEKIDEYLSKQTDLLISKLNDKDECLLVNVVDGLGALGQNKAIHPLCNLLVNFPFRDPFSASMLKQTIINAMGNFELKEEITDFLIARLHNEQVEDDFYTKKAIVKVLRKIESPKVIHALTITLNGNISRSHKEPGRQESRGETEFLGAVAKALGTYAKIEDLINLWRLLEFDLIYRTTGESCVQKGNIMDKLVQRIGPDGSLEDIMRIYKNQSQKYIKATVGALDDELLFRIELLGTRGTSEDMEALIRMLDQGYPPTVNQNIIWNLGKAKTNKDKVIDKLCMLFDNEGWAIRLFVACALGELKAKVAVPLLIKGLEIENHKPVKVGIIWTMGEIGEKEETVPVLIDIIRKNQDSEDYKLVIVTAIEALGKIASYKAIDVLISILDNKDVSIRKQAVEALSQIMPICGSEQFKIIVSRLIKLLESNYALTKKAVIIALKKMCSKEVMLQPLLEELKCKELIIRGDKEMSVRCEAAMALGEIGAEEAIKPLCDLLIDWEYRNVSINNTVPEALLQIGTKEAITAIFKTFHLHFNVGVLKKLQKELEGTRSYYTFITSNEESLVNTILPSHREKIAICMLQHEQNGDYPKKVELDISS